MTLGFDQEASVELAGAADDGGSADRQAAGIH